jgi:hypothetical protein
MKQWFASIASVAQCYDSDDVRGRASGYPYEWKLLTRVVEGHSAFGRDCTGDLSDCACRTIAKELLPLSYGFTAGFIVKFLLDVQEPVPRTYSATVALESFRVRGDVDRRIQDEATIDFGCLTAEKTRGDGGLWVRTRDYGRRGGETHAVDPPVSHVLQFDGDEKGHVFLAFDVWRCDGPARGPGNWLASAVDLVCGGTSPTSGSSDVTGPEVLLSARTRHAFSAWEQLAETGRKTESVKSDGCDVGYSVAVKRISEMQRQ